MFEKLYTIAIMLFLHCVHEVASLSKVELLQTFFNRNFVFFFVGGGRIRFYFGQLKFRVNQQKCKQKDIFEVSLSIASGYHSSVILLKSKQTIL